MPQTPNSIPLRAMSQLTMGAMFFLGILASLVVEQFTEKSRHGLAIATGTAAIALGILIFRSGYLVRLSEARRDEIERQLRTSQALFNTIIENIPDMIFLKDAKDLRFVLFNRSGEKLLGFSRDDLIGKNDYDIFPKDQADFFTNKDREILEANILLDIPEEPIETKYLGRRLLHTKKLAILGEDGQAKYLLGISEDITERTLAERRVSEQQKQLLVSAKMSALGEMAGSIAHEVNNPLSVILGKTEQLRECLGQGERDLKKTGEALEKIEVTARRISKIVKGLRTFARDGERDPFLRTTLASILDETLSLCTQRFLNHGIKLEVGEYRKDLMLECRAVQVSQVLINLLSNAFDAIDSLREKWVRIEVAQNADMIEIRVTDSGSGIPQGIREKMMQPFFSTKEIGKGTGLGLSISKGIIEDHRGQLFIASDSPNTQFVVILPMRQEAPQASETTPALSA